MNLKALPKEKLLQSIAYYIGFIALGLAMVSTGPALPNLVANTDSTIDAFAVVFTIASLGALTGSFLGGKIFDRFHGNIVIGIALLLMAALLFITPTITSLTGMAAVMFLMAAALTQVDLGTNTLMTWVHGKDGAAYMNALHFFYGIGAALCPLLVGKMIDLSGDIRGAYWLLAALMLPAAMLIFLTPSPNIRPIKTTDTATGQQNRRRLAVILLMVFFTLYVAIESNFGKYIFSYIQNQSFSTQTDAGYEINSIFWVMLTLGRLIAVPIASKLKPAAIISIDFAGVVAGLLTIVIFPESITAIWVGTILLGLSLASIFPTALIFAEKHLHLTGRITSYFYLAISVGSMFFPWFIGQFFEQKGAFSFIIILGAITVLELLIWGITVFITNKNTIESKEPA